MEEEAAKVDTKLSFRHAFRPEKLLTVHAQVKSGASYRAASSNFDALTLNIDKSTINALSGSNTPGLIVWVPPKPMDRLYWYASDPRRPLSIPVKIPRHQFVRPSIRYDLTRLFDYSSWSNAISMQTVSQASDLEIMPRAREEYRCLKSRMWPHPLVGSLAVTRLAWRHKTRRSKTKKQRMLSLRIVPYLKRFVDKAPTRFVRDQSIIAHFGTRTVDTRYLLCWYRGALSISGDKYTLLLRIKEEVSYPTNWSEHPLRADEIEQKATLASWWCKKEA